ncbi:MAG TPA: glycosyltransferase family 39 protein [Anaeromyxobacteraceae bacterium]|nr:glycosyltransferase family 39 protein [Anaeromyxobacteraceae bacterium]
MASSTVASATEPTELKGQSPSFGWAGGLLVVAFVLAGLWLRLRGLSAEGFNDDEVHKWLAALRYLHGDFGGDDLEHPMLMKSLIALAVAAGRKELPLETLTRLPSALAGGLTVGAVALLGKRLFGVLGGLFAAGLLAFSTAAIGYHRVAKEDALLTLFFVLCLLCLCEAQAAAEDRRTSDQARCEALSALFLGAAFASKYFFFYFPIPVLAYLWMRPVSTWRVPFFRWLTLVALALCVFLILNFAVLLPSSWGYYLPYMRGEHVGGDRGVSESIVFMGRLYGNMAFDRRASPFYYFPVFFAVKLAPTTAVLAACGLVLALVRRAPAHRLLLVWLFIFWLTFEVAGAKYARFSVDAFPAVVLLAGYAAASLCRLALKQVRLLAAAPKPALGAALTLCLFPEALVSLEHGPHYRLYVNAFGGGDARVDFFYPHCDYFDVGVREAIAWVASHAEPGAVVASEVDWTVRLYAPLFGRKDLVSSPILPSAACGGVAPCYVLVEPGRLYWHNEAALGLLALKRPVHLERVEKQTAVSVYRLAAGEALFPPETGKGTLASP